MTQFAPQGSPGTPQWQGLGDIVRHSSMSENETDGECGLITWLTSKAWSVNDRDNFEIKKESLLVEVSGLSLSH